MTLTTVTPTTAIADVWHSVEERGYSLLPEEDLGGSAAFREYLRMTYFTPDVLGVDHPGVHRDRDRARDVVRYEWTSAGDLLLDEHDTIEITDRSGFAGTRLHPRVKLLDDPAFTSWIRRAIAAVPPALRRNRGTFAVNLFRTRTDVVAGPHQDNEDIILIYVVGKSGLGATTRLIPVATPEVTALEVTLEAGEAVIFRDALFLHDVSPLISEPGESAVRDVLVCTVNYEETYPLPY